MEEKGLGNKALGILGPGDMNNREVLPISKTQHPNRLRTQMILLQPTIVNPKKLETGLRTNSAGIPYTLLLRIEAIGFPTFGLLLYVV